MTETAGGATPEERDSADASGPRVLLIGWDAADWKFVRPMLDAGETPNLKRFIDEGCSGNIATLQPALSPMLWTSVATGKLADKHNILGFAEPDGTTGRSRPVTSTSRRCKAIWNILSDRGRPAGAVNWYASHPAERIEGFVVTDRYAHPTGPLDPSKDHLGWPTVPRSVWPDEDLEALAEVRVHPAMITQEMVRDFVPDAKDESSARWPKIAELRALLAHGATVHNAATAYIQERPWDFLGIYYDMIDRMAHAFMEYHPPRMDHVSEEDFGRYSGVMRACYVLHDQMLGRLMNLIDERTVVCLVSDHGFHCDELRPRGTSAIKDGQPVSWHRPYGMVGFWGPGIKRGERLFGASLLDIAPTLLALLGLPVARDMDGAPLTQILDAAPDSLDTVETYEIEGEARDDSDPEDAGVSEMMLEQLRRLGYVGADDAQAVSIDRTRNLGIVYLSTGRPVQAAEQFEKILETSPDDRGAKMSLLSAAMSTGRYEECDRLCDELSADGVDRPRITFMRALVASARGEDDRAVELLRESEAADPGHPGIARHLGQAYLKRGRHEEAEAQFERALTLDPDDAPALDGLGRVYHETGRFPQAVLAHMRAIALEHHRPATHLSLAKSLVRVGRLGWALEAIGVALRMTPGSVEAHELAAQLYEQRLDNPAKAAFHRERIRVIREAIARGPERPAGTKRRAHAGAPKPKPRPAGRVDFTLPTEPVVLVSGLPRSGTSLMMQMLDAGGFPVLTDGRRAADENNPRGYYELEAVKDTARDPSWLTEAGGKAVKLVHVHLPAIPDGVRCRVIFMRREIGDIVASQSRMLERLGADDPTIDTGFLRDAFERDLMRALARIDADEKFGCLQVSYDELVADPEPRCREIAAFLGGDLDLGAMVRVIDPELYRRSFRDAEG